LGDAKFFSFDVPKLRKTFNFHDPKFRKFIQLQMIFPLHPFFFLEYNHPKSPFFNQLNLIANQLNLKYPKRNSETRNFLKVMSETRLYSQKKRSERLHNNPLFERMRISAQFPRLSVDVPDKITVKTEIGGFPNSPKISQQISIKSTVFEAMKIFYDLYFKRMKTKFPFTSGPEELIFQVSNTDEIVDGDHPLIHFVCVREFLANLVCVQELSKTNIFTLTILYREKVID
jgi:hypothetical protein